MNDSHYKMQFMALLNIIFPEGPPPEVTKLEISVGENNFLYYFDPIDVQDFRAGKTRKRRTRVRTPKVPPSLVLNRKDLALLKGMRIIVENPEPTT